MSRTLKRVPLDFDAPLNETWQGYICPIKVDNCKTCGGDGQSPEYNTLIQRWFGWDRPAKWVSINSRQRYNSDAMQYNLEQADIDVLWDEGRMRDFKEKPTVEQANDYYRRASLFGHDAINRWIVIKARLKRANLPIECAHCHGNGAQSKEAYDQMEAWESTEPPKGDGYQLWNDSGDGCPCSPVFTTLEDLSAYAAVHCTTFGSEKATKEQWMDMLEKNNVHYEKKIGDNTLIFM